MLGLPYTFVSEVLGGSVGSWEAAFAVYGVFQRQRFGRVTHPHAHLSLLRATKGRLGSPELRARVVSSLVAEDRDRHFSAERLLVVAGPVVRAAESASEGDVLWALLESARPDVFNADLRATLKL
jgi:hypothetical protein